MQCKIDNESKSFINWDIYYDFVRPGSPHWYLYMVLSLVVMSIFGSKLVLILLIKGVQSCVFSTTAVGYHYYDRSIDGSNSARFVLSSYIFFQMWFGMVLWGFYYLFNLIYHEQHSPCFGGRNWTLLTETLLSDRVAVLICWFNLVHINLPDYSVGCLWVWIDEFPPSDSVLQ